MTCFRLKSGVPLHSICTLKSISYRSALGRIEKGDVPDDALKYAKERAGKGCALNNCQHFLSNGDSFRSVCLREKLNNSRGYYLIKKGMTPDEALAFLMQKKKAKEEAAKELESRGVPKDVSPTGFKLLKALKKNKYASYASDIAKEVHTTRHKWYHGYLDTLERSGYIETTIYYKGRLPKKFVVMTDKGKAIFNPKKEKAEG